MEEIIVATDGSAYPNTTPPSGKGGWAFVVRWAEKEAERYDHLPIATNQSAELTAILMALRFVKKSKHPLTIYTDSEYAYKCINIWRYRWEECGWKNTICQPVANRELIEGIAERVEWHRKFRECNVKWIRGHQKDKSLLTALNNRADVLAGMARTELIFCVDGL